MIGRQGQRQTHFFHIEGTANLADLLTKKHEIRIEDVSKGSDWIEGLDWMRKARSEMPLTSYEDLTIDKSAEEKVKMECFPESFLKEFSTEHKDVLDKLKVVDEIEDENLEFSVLADKAGRGVAELLVDSVFHGWRSAMRITACMDGEQGIVTTSI